MRSCKRREKLRCDTSMVAGQGLGFRVAETAKSMGVRGVGLAEIQWILLDLPLTLRNLDVRELKTLGNITVGT